MAGLSNVHPQHGGNLHEAVTTYGIPRSRTGWICPAAFPPGHSPVRNCRQTYGNGCRKADSEELEQAAQAYCSATALPIPGSQWAIQQLPPW
ncbi:MAG: hypothetical protein R3F38_04965 [Gammaproteobacteria bacterium]